MCVCKNETGEDDSIQLPDQDTPALIRPQDTATAAISSATSTHATPAARKRRQSEFDAQCSKSMECLQDLIKTRLEKKTDDEDDIFGKMIACECRKIKNPRVKRTLKKNISDLMFAAVEDDEAVNCVGASDQVFLVLQPNQQIVEQ